MEETLRFSLQMLAGWLEIRLNAYLKCELYVHASYNYRGEIHAAGVRTGWEQRCQLIPDEVDII